MHHGKSVNVKRLAYPLFAGLILLTGILACSGTSQVSEKTGNSPDTEDKYERMEEMYWAKVDSSRMQFTQADVDFMIGMIAHHAQALIMSDLAPENNAGPSVRTLASRIINAQKDEIQSMQQWLRDRNQPVPEVHIDGLILTIQMNGHEGTESRAHSDTDHEAMGHGTGNMHHSGMDHSGMPGMLTQDQLNELATLKGQAFDRMFLSSMIEHHEGAVTMVKTLFDTDGAALDEQAFRLASDIQVDQRTEIERMKLMLKNMTDS